MNTDYIFSDMDEPVDLTKQLQSLGREDGLCGKNADLDYGGQVKVKSCYWHDDGTVTAELQVYANICEPSQCDDESDKDYSMRRDAFADLVCYWDGYPGEWTGNDYWTFSIADRPHHVKLSHDWIDYDTDEVNEAKAAQAIYKAIFDDEAIKAFQDSMTQLSKASDGLII